MILFIVWSKHSDGLTLLYLTDHTFRHIIELCALLSYVFTYLPTYLLTLSTIIKSCYRLSIMVNITFVVNTLVGTT